MSQKLFNQIIGVLFSIKAFVVFYYLLMGIKVTAFFGVTPGWLSILVIVLSICFAYIAFSLTNKQKPVLQKLFDRFFGILCALDALVSLYYLSFGVKMMLGNQVFPIWLLVVITMVDIYLFYTAFSLAKKIK
jgi:hypothetical protein